MEISFYLSDTAQKLFENLKKRYSKRRQAVLKASKSGSGRSDVATVNDQLKDYEFLAWINPFIKTRRSKSNFAPLEEASSSNIGEGINDDDNEYVEEEEEEEVEQDDRDSLFDNSPDLPKLENETNLPFNTDSTTFSQSKLEKRKSVNHTTPPSRPKAKKASTKENKKDELLSTMSLLMKQRIDKNASKNEEEDVFGGMISNELKKLPELLKVQAKHEINGVIFKYQMQNQQQKSYLTNQQNLPNLFPVQQSHDSSMTSSTLSSPINPFEGNKISNWLAMINNKDN